MGIQAFQAVLFLAVPALAMWLVARSRIAETLSAVALCYITGLILGNLGFIPLDGDFSKEMGGVAVVLAIPLLLFSMDVPAWLRSSGSVIAASLIAFGSFAAMAIGAGIYFQPRLEESWKIGGGLASVFSGGTPNFISVSNALDLSPEAFVLTNASDMMISGIYFLFLLSFGARFFGLIFRPSPRLPEPAAEFHDPDQRTGLDWVSLLKGFGISALLVLLALGISMLFAAETRDMSVIIAVSTLAIGASFVRPIRKLPGTFALGEYIILIFCVAMGSMVNLSELAAADPNIFLMTAMVIGGALVLQNLLFYFMRIDRDTAIVASAAAMYSPPLVIPIANRLGNKHALMSGVTIGLVGYGLGTYVGLAVAATIRIFVVQ